MVGHAMTTEVCRRPYRTLVVNSLTTRALPRRTVSSQVNWSSASLTMETRGPVGRTTPTVGRGTTLEQFHHSRPLAGDHRSHRHPRWCGWRAARLGWRREPAHRDPHRRRRVRRYRAPCPYDAALRSGHGRIDQPMRRVAEDSTTGAAGLPIARSARARCDNQWLPRMREGHYDRQSRCSSFSDRSDRWRARRRNGALRCEFDWLLPVADLDRQPLYHHPPCRRWPALPQHTEQRHAMVIACLSLEGCHAHRLTGNLRRR